jgi:hypothetical protein
VTDALQLGLDALERTVPKHETEIRLLIPVAQELAKRAGPAGITVGNLRLAAVHRGIISGFEVGRRLSYLGAVMKRAGLKPTDHTRRSSVGRSHGNLHRVWVEA